MSGLLVSKHDIAISVNTGTATATATDKHRVKRRKTECIFSLNVQRLKIREHIEQCLVEKVKQLPTEHKYHTTPKEKVVKYAKQIEQLLFITTFTTIEEYGNLGSLKERIRCLQQRQEQRDAANTLISLGRPTFL